MTLSC